ncbi:MAG TPA: L,D-transpeptidase family protein [Sphingomicrobium sp.]|nr:L,D-transpeptidase family protein [Sphingomicrobium sp.]
MRVWALCVAAAAVALAVPALAQDDVAPEPAKAPVQAVAPNPAPDSNVAPFYTEHPGMLVWLKDADTRAAAAKLVEVLKRSPIDGFTDGPTLAATVDAAIVRGQPLDDQTISTAWVRYVQWMKRPVDGVSFGDPKLQLKSPTASNILTVTSAAPSLAGYIDSIADPNPLYQALRDTAVAAGQQDDPHVRASLDRLRLIPAKGRAILVDAANAQLTMLEDGKVVDTMKVIVGQAKYPTPLIASKIWYVTFNPYWHIPTDVAKRKVAPIVLKRGVHYLTLARYQTVAAFGGDKEQPVDPTSIDWKAVAAGTAEAHIRQLSGPHNMMGAMKFGFVNDYGIFLHDTPEKALFAKDPRNLSLGCVRVEHPQALAEWLFGHEPPAAPADDSEQNVLIGDKGVPIYISYLTARPDGDKIAFADDVYKLDGAPGIAVTAAAASAKR